MTLRIIQLSDTHISTEHPQRTRDLENCIDVINQSSMQADLVIHTGDVSHNGSSEEYQTAKSLLDRLNAPYWVLAGNRDNRAVLLQTFADSHCKIAAINWVQYALNEYPVKLVMVDTVCEHSNKGELCAARLHHLQSMLTENPEKPTVLFLHHPPYPATGIPDPLQYENWQDVERLDELLRRFKNIKAMYCGHVHRFIDGEISGIPASAISCLAGDLRKGTVTDAERKQPIYKVLDLEYR